MDSTRSERELRFLAQAGEFAERARQDSTSLAPHDEVRPLRATPVRDFRELSAEERRSIVEAYRRDGAATFVVLNPDEKPSQSHPLFDIVRQLEPDLPLQFPLIHPLESHPGTIQRFGGNDGTLKIYNKPKAGTGYIEQGETADQFDMHSDGLGSGGTVQAFLLYMDSPPLDGGYLYLQDIARLALELKNEDEQAFEALFLPDAIRVVRPRGKGAIKVTGPVLYLNEVGQPQCFYRQPSGEYEVSWRNDDSLARARAFLDARCRPFAPGSAIIHMMARGHGCIVANQRNVHGRTAFIDGPHPSQQRVLARKWFMRTAQHAVYKHVPALHVDRHYGQEYPGLFGEDLLQGEWLYDASRDLNERQA